MSFKKFLSESKYAFLVAKIAIIFQTVFTVCIGSLLLTTIITPTYPKILLSFFLLFDILFVFLHLTYRRLYTGTKIVLKPFEKKVLIYHIISSMLALGITSYIVFAGIDNAYEWMCLALASWIVSLISGIIFFYKKYSSYL
jgi:hypothetical protein